MKIILKKTNKKIKINFINNNKIIYFLQNNKKNFNSLFKNFKKILIFFNKKIFINKKYNGYLKKINDFIILKNG